MKFLPHINNGNRVFRLLKHQKENFPATFNVNRVQQIKPEWTLVEENPSLLVLLSKYGMLNISKYEMQWAKQQVRKMDSTTLDYCMQQSKSITKYADDSIYRIATRTFHEKDFALYARRGLPSEVRRSVLALTIQMGVVLK